MIVFNLVYGYYGGFYGGGGIWKSWKKKGKDNLDGRDNMCKGMVM